MAAAILDGVPALVGADEQEIDPVDAQRGQLALGCRLYSVPRHGSDRRDRIVVGRLRRPLLGLTLTDCAQGVESPNDRSNVTHPAEPSGFEPIAQQCAGLIGSQSAGAVFVGRVIVIVVPCDGSLSARMLPPWISVIRLQIASPSPWPFPFAEPLRKG